MACRDALSISGCPELVDTSFTTVKKAFEIQLQMITRKTRSAMIDEIKKRLKYIKYPKFECKTSGDILQGVIHHVKSMTATKLENGRIKQKY